MIKSTIKYKPLLFFICTFVITWTSWFVAEIIQQNNSASKWYECFMLLGLAAPFITALCLIFQPNNQKLKKIFFNKLLNLRLIKAKSIIAILAIPPLSIILAIIISLFFGFSYHQFSIADSFSFHIGSAPTLLVLFVAASLEELGWRGYAVESLSCKLSYFNATALFSVLWASWHLPLFFIAHTYQGKLYNHIVYCVEGGEYWVAEYWVAVYWVAEYLVAVYWFD